ncbi:uncharacterized protein LOC113172679 [Anabas testudineus]|uniref:uncharacterized protein LOC113172679 n=1 Tax=Anabas testudineus TaxID=64144 RepID=UPI000E460C7C|nr:uncharacterized protein LOC113172679 [Anabas testudineus]
MRRSRNTEMTASGFNIIFTVYLSFLFHLSHGFQVIQPQNRSVNSDGVATITCEFAAEEEISSVQDVRLYRISQSDNKRTLLCQKGKKNCSNVFMHLKNVTNPKKWLFILWDLGPKDVNMLCECEFTVNDKNDIHKTTRGTPTRLLGQKETETDCAPPSPLPPSPQYDQLNWILSGLLALLFLCVCVIICLYIKRRKIKEEPENGTYVEMRKAPLPRNPPAGVYCGN